MKFVPLCKVTTIVTGIQDYCWGHRGPVQPFLLVSNRNNCIPVLPIPLTPFTGLKLFRPRFNVGACQLVHTGGDSVSSESSQRPDTEKPEEGTIDNILSTAIPVDNILSMVFLDPTIF